MKIKRETEITVCDICRKQETGLRCNICGKDVCYQHSTNYKVTKYPEYGKCIGKRIRVCPGCEANLTIDDLWEKGHHEY